ncbi:MAG: sugar transferase [Mogibacterium sp.]|nr:sugar transferase [Mogibacterium sp.]MBR4090365.1 sugar transferase [Mogibacterium sp.]
MYKKYIKRLLDLFISIIGLPVFGIIFIIVGPLIHKEDGGPVFYNATRLGKDKKPFKMYKFRSMRVNAPDYRNEDGTTYNGDEDPRVTRIGRFIRKTSIDETPQILNVLKGEMSIIGPRPDLMDALDVFEPGEEKKLEVRPGITGYSQAYHRNMIELHDRFAEDVYYANNVSFRMDLNIFLKTIQTVLLRKGVYRDESNRKIVEKERQ